MGFQAPKNGHQPGPDLQSAEPFASFAFHVKFGYSVQMLAEINFLGEKV